MTFNHVKTAGVPSIASGVSRGRLRHPFERPAAFEQPPNILSVYHAVAGTIAKLKQLRAENSQEAGLAIASVQERSVNDLKRSICGHGRAAGI
jgi:hypothetical protein